MTVFIRDLQILENSHQKEVLRNADSLKKPFLRLGIGHTTIGKDFKPVVEHAEKRLADIPVIMDEGVDNRLINSIHVIEVGLFPRSYCCIDHADVLGLEPRLQGKIGVDDRLPSKVISLRHGSFVLSPMFPTKPSHKVGNKSILVGNKVGNKCGFLSKF